MTDDRFRFEPLGPTHDRAAFSCGVEALDGYLHRQAGQEMRRNVVAVWVLADLIEDRIAGFYTLSAASIEPAQLPADVARRLPRYPTLPAILIGRLAIDRRYQGQGLGGLLLFDALQRILGLTRQTGITAVIVDAKDDAARRFYERYDFRALSDQARRLFLPTATIARLTSDR